MSTSADQMKAIIKEVLSELAAEGIVPKSAVPPVQLDALDTLEFAIDTGVLAQYQASNIKVLPYDATKATDAERIAALEEHVAALTIVTGHATSISMAQTKALIQAMTPPPPEPAADAPPVQAAA